MKQHRNVTARQEALSERSLLAAVTTLKNVDEARAFFRDLCTPAELQALADRWAVVGLLQQGLPYREIQRHTGVSVTTVGRVARYLSSGNGGYALAALCAAALALYLNTTRAEAAIAGTLTALAVYPIAVMWVFATRSAARAWGGLALASALPGLALLAHHYAGSAT